MAEKKERRVPALLGAYINRNLATGHLTEKSAENYTNDIMLFFKYLVMLSHGYRRLENVSDERVCDEIKDEQILAVSKDDVWGFVLHMRKDRHLKDATIKRRINAIANLYRELRDQEDLIDVLPTEGVKIDNKEKKTPVFLTQEEWEELLETTARVSRYKERDICIVLFLLNLGLRRGEIEALDSADVKITRSGSYIHIHGKGRKERNLPLNETCIESYRRYMKARPHAATEADSFALFLSNRGKRMTASAIYKMIKHMAKEAGLSPEVTTHSLRHTFGTNAIKIGTINQVQKLMGHESIATTTIYTHISDEGLADIINANPANQPRQYTLEDMKKGEKK